MIQLNQLTLGVQAFHSSSIAGILWSHDQFGLFWRYKVITVKTSAGCDSAVSFFFSFKEV